MKLSMVELIIDGLQTDGGHHKQWYLEQILIELVGKKKIKEMKEYYGDWEEGIAP